MSEKQYGIIGDGDLPRGITSPLPPTMRLPFLELPLPPIATGVDPGAADSLALAPLGGVEIAEATLEEGLDTAGGPRDQADALGVGDWLAGLFDGDEALLICVSILVEGERGGGAVGREERGLRVWSDTTAVVPIAASGWKNRGDCTTCRIQAEGESKLLVALLSTERSSLRVSVRLQKTRQTFQPGGFLSGPEESTNVPSPSGGCDKRF